MLLVPLGRIISLISLSANGQVALVGYNDATMDHLDAQRMTYSWISNGSEVKNLYLLKMVLTTIVFITLMTVVKSSPLATQSIRKARRRRCVFYEVTGKMTRTEALKEAVAQFTEAVAQNAKETGADHKIAMIGFAEINFRQILLAQRHMEKPFMITLIPGCFTKSLLRTIKQSVRYPNLQPTTSIALI